MFFAFAAGPLTLRFAKKHLLLAGMFLGFLGGVIAYLFGSISLNVLYLSSLFIGINQGLNGSLTKALVPDFFEGQERDDMLGYQASSSTAGSIALTMVAGILAGIFWKNSYLVFLAFIPCMLLVQKNITYVPPVKKIASAGEKVKLTPTVYFTAITIFVSYVFLFCHQANISVFIKSNNLGNVTTAGYANSIFVTGGLVTGLLFGKFRKVLGNKTMQAGLLVLVVGFLGNRFIGNLPAAFFSAFCTGVAQAFLIPSCVLAVSAYTPESMRAVAISIVMGALNFGMFMSPKILNPLTAAIGGGDLHLKYMYAAIGLIVVTILYSVLSPIFYPKDEYAKKATI
jgi:MFS family permease